jgi:transcriptional regulator with GAF, ATPase, and Fis domain
LIGRCAAMQDVYKAIGRVAPQNVTVLIRGDSGTGKELVARAIYQHGTRSDRQFLAVNCAAIPESLLESELFGHEKGAFTGAESRRVGKFEQCSGGTLFLDEIGDMSPLTQSKILRVVQEQRFQRVGGSEIIETDVRIIAASNRNLGDMVAENRFRADLYYRLSVFEITLPPLRERTGDLPILLEHFLHQYNKKLGKEIGSFSADAVERLRCYDWPGNVRELQGVVMQALLRATGPIILLDFLPSALQSVGNPSGKPASSNRSVPDIEAFVEKQLQSGSQSLHGDLLRHVERYLLARVLRHTAGNQLQAAKTLGITRGSLRNKIRSLGIKLDTTAESEDDDSEIP